VNAGEGGATSIALSARVGLGGWTADGAQLAFSEHVDSAWHLRVLRPDRGDVTTVSTDEQRTAGGWPTAGWCSSGASRAPYRAFRT
jgi:hypothetical protein